MSAQPPSFATVEVTTDSFLEGSNLSRTTHADLMRKLSAFEPHRSHFSKILSNIEQTSGRPIGTIARAQIAIMEELTSEKLWRLEVNNPQTTTDWRTLWVFDEDQFTALQELRDELNRINAPVQLRIVRNSD